MSREKERKMDRVCGMCLDDLPDTPSVTHNGQEYRFCGDGCAKRFEHSPSRYLGEPLVKIRGLRKHFGEDGYRTDVLNGIDLNVWRGDFVAIIGASGSGKSTLLNMIGLLDEPSSGTMEINGRSALSLSQDERVQLRGKTFGFVFQQYNLIPWLTVYDNIALPMIFAGADAREHGGRIEEMAERVGIAHRMTHRPAELSGGEQQRVAILRALANNPDVIIGDEPTGNLDSKTGGEILDLLIRQNRELGKTLIVVTHDASIAERAAEVIVIKDGKTLRDQRIHQLVYAD